MIQHVSIRNFRAFESLEVSGLKVVNVIVGQNSSGKSSFLEALYLSSTSAAPTAVFQMRNIRRVGGANIQVPADVFAYKNLWEDVFYDFDTNRRIKIEIKGSGGDQRSLAISFRESMQVEIPFGKDASSKNSAGGLPQIVFIWKRGGGREIIVKPTVTNTGLQLGNIVIDFAPLIWFTAGADAAEDLAKRFSALSKTRDVGPILSAIQGEFDFIDDLSIEYLSNVPMVFASVKGRRNKIPVGLLSDGINRLLAILTGIAYFKNGAVLIDQIEDGLYFSHLSSVWRVLLSFASAYNVQLFVTTHSKECIQALRPALEGNESNFQLLRAERKEDATCHISQFSGSDLLAALEERIDVR
jgi:AAA15 family ATPase/GTPase